MKKNPTVDHHLMDMINLVLVGIVCSVIGFMIGYRFALKPQLVAVITNYDQCAKAGYPIRESYPAQCSTPDGRVFLQDVNKIVPPVEPSNAEKGGGVACTLEAKQCSDGTYVGRVPPSCEFAECPK